MNKVLIAAGGSGGHIFPAIALGRSLKASYKEVDMMYVGSIRALDARMFEKERVRFATISANRLPYKISLEIITASFRLLMDVFKALFIMISYGPNVVVGFGGYVSFPVILAASILGIPTIVHEQNVVPGRANRLLFTFADKIALSFEGTKGLTARSLRKRILTGNPIRREISMNDRLYSAKRFGLAEDKFTILVMGGSQGAAFLNSTFIDAISRIDSIEKNSMQVIHITGVKDYEWALEAYEDLRIDYRVHSFIDRIEEAYGAADLVVTRSGASAIFELAALRKPMILIPYPYALCHQLDNALMFAKNDAAIVIEEKDLNPEMFSNLLLHLMKDRGRRQSLGKAAFALALPKAADSLASEVLNLARKRHA